MAWERSKAGMKKASSKEEKGFSGTFNGSANAGHKGKRKIFFSIRGVFKTQLKPCTSD